MNIKINKNFSQIKKKFENISWSIKLHCQKDIVFWNEIKKWKKKKLELWLRV